MVVNFRAYGISRGARKLTRTPTLNYKKKKEEEEEKTFKKKNLTHNSTKLKYILHNTCVMYYFSMIKIEIKYWKAEL